MHDTFPVLERGRKPRTQLCFILRRDLHVRDRQLDRVFDETRKTRPAVSRKERAVHAQMRVALPGRPLRQVRIHALAPDDERRQQPDACAAEVAEDARHDAVHTLRLDRHIAIGAVLRTELHVPAAQKVIDLGKRRDCPLTAATARTLLDRDGRRNAEDRVHVGPRGSLHELACIGVERLQVAALSLLNRMSKASVDLPEPETPVTTVNLPRGIATSSDLRLCSARVIHAVALAGRVGWTEDKPRACAAVE